MSNLAFDTSICEMYTAFLNGGTLIPIDYMKVLDYQAMSKIFASSKIQATIFIPVLLKQCLLECSSIASTLNSLYVSGERANVEDLPIVRSFVRVV